MLPEIVPIERKHLGEYFVDPETGIKFRLMMIENTTKTTHAWASLPKQTGDEVYIFRVVDASDNEVIDKYPGSESFYPKEYMGIHVRIEDPCDFLYVDEDFNYEDGCFCGACGKACGVDKNLESTCCHDAIFTSSLLDEETDTEVLRQFYEEAKATPYANVPD